MTLLNVDGNIPWLKDVTPAEMQRIVDALYCVHHLFSSITDIDTLLERILDESKQVARAEACSLLLYDPAAGDLHFHLVKGETGDPQALKREVRLAMNQGIAGASAATRRPVNVPDASRDPRFYREADAVTGFTTRSLLAVPLVDRDTLVGVVEVVNKVGGGAFTETDVHVLVMFSSLAAAAIVNARLIEQNLRAERMAAIGEAVAHVSHYTKNILSGMAGSIDLVEQGLKRNEMDILRRCWPILRRSTQRISDCVQDMLAFSRPRAPRREPCSVASLLDEAVQAMADVAARKQVTVTTRADTGAPPVMLDSDGIFRCLLNLLSNAIDAVSSTGGTVRLSAELNSGGTLAFECADNGPGVPAAYAETVFDPFYSTKGSQGTGLGLAVTRKIVQEHGGTVTVWPAPEGGALFRVELPVAVS